MHEILEGLRLLIVEDEALIAMLLEDMLTDLGCVVVGVANSQEEALKRVASGGFDAAVLDVNLSGAESYPVAYALKEQAIPFVFSTGYGGKVVPESVRRVPVLVKPFEAVELERGLLEMIRGYRP